MSLIAFENTLKSIANDKMQMSYGNNFNVVNELLTITNMLKSLSIAVSGDQMKDAFSMTLSGKIAELENTVVTLGTQRLMMCGINTISPFMANTSMNNQQFNMGWMPNPMPNPMMYSQQPQQQYQQPQMQQPYQHQQQAPQQQMQQQPQMQQPYQPQQNSQPQMQPERPQPAAQPTPQPSFQQQSQAAAPSYAQEKTFTPHEPAQSSGGGGGGISFNLPGGNSGEKAVGRDYLLQLLEEKEGGGS